MKDMKLTQDDHEKMAEPTVATNGGADKGPEYPYGLRVHLDESSLTKVGFDQLPKVGQEMGMQCIVRVVSVGDNASEHGKQRHIELQITKLEMGKDVGSEEDAEESQEKVAQKLYGGQ